ncbi:MAG: FGGY family carbohydrate kinase, partial [Thermoproteota archaeon]
MSEDLEVVAETSLRYETRIPKPGWAEQDPNDWWGAAFMCLKSISKTLNEKNVKVSGIGLTGQMHSLVLLDNEG